MNLTGPVLTEEQLLELPVLTLAYEGDAVWELLTRTHLCRRGGRPGDLSRAATDFVSAPAQAEAAGRILSRLTDGEAAVFRRGRNARVGGIPKGATPEQYHAATGLEALFGALWLSGRQDRAEELFLAAFPAEAE